MDNQFNSLQFAMVGFSQVVLDNTLLESLRDVIANQQWINDTTEEGIQEADWCAGGKNRQDPVIVPASYVPFLDYLDDLTTQIFGGDVVRDKVMVWRGGETLDWHEHISDGELRDFHWLIYLGADNWNVEVGGLLMLKNALDPEDTYTIEPTYGTVVVLNNTHKNYLHKVTEYSPIRERIVLQVGYGRIN